MSKLTGNKDVDILIINMLNDYELGKVCQANKYVSNICKDDSFWTIRTYEKFGEKLKEFDIDISKYKKSSWKDYYILLSTVEKKASKDFKIVTEIGGPWSIIKTDTPPSDWDKLKKYRYTIVGDKIEKQGIDQYKKSYEKTLNRQGYVTTDRGHLLILTTTRKDLLAIAFITVKGE